MAICRKKITVDVRGEILQLKEAIHTMVDSWRSSPSEVTRVARESAPRVSLATGDRARRVAGTWEDLTG